MNDLSSRQAAIECLEMFLDKQCDRERTKARGFSDNDIWAAVNMAYDALTAEVTLCHLDSPCEYQNADIAMPTAERVGKWERKWHTFFRAELYYCSACGYYEAFERNFCPNCGARMVKGEEG